MRSGDLLLENHVVDSVTRSTFTMACLRDEQRGLCPQRR